MPANEFPPSTREEFDDFFADVVRARLIYLLSPPPVENKNAPSTSTSDLSKGAPSLVVQGTAAQTVGDFKCRYCIDCEGKEEKVKKEKQHQKDKKKVEKEARKNKSTDSESNNPTFLTTQTSPPQPPIQTLSYTAHDLIWLDTQIAQSVALSIAAQRYHPSTTNPTPQGWVDWHQQFFSAVVGVAVLGAGFTFSVIFNDFSSPTSSLDNDKDSIQDGARQRYIRTCLAAAWMLFVLSIGVTSGATLLIHVHRSRLVARFTRVLQKEEKWWNSWSMRLLTMGDLLIELIPIGAFLASAEAVRRYHKVLGAVSLAFISLFAAILIVLWCFQNLLSSKGPARCLLAKL